MISLFVSPADAVKGVSKWTSSKESRDFTFKSAAEVTTWKFVPWEGGSYNITFTVADAYDVAA